MSTKTYSPLPLISLTLCSSVSKRSSLELPFFHTFILLKMPIAHRGYHTRHNEAVFGWTYEVGREGEIEEEFPTLVGLPKLKISCKCKCVQARVIDRKVPTCFQVQYCLSYCDIKSISSGTKNVINSLKVSCVEALIKPFKKSPHKDLIFTPSDLEKTWTSETFEWKPAAPFSTADRIPMSVEIMIRFKSSFSRGQENALLHLLDLFIQQKNCNVQFSFNDNQQIGGHVDILATRSPVFAAMFQAGRTWTEATTSQVNVPDIEFKVFKELLHYIYSGKIEKPLNQEMAQSLLLAADKYDVVDLKDECSEIVISNVKIENAISLMIWSYTHSINKVLEAVFSTAAQHKEKICQQEDWKMLLTDFLDLGILATQRMMTRK